MLQQKAMVPTRSKEQKNTPSQCFSVSQCLVFFHCEELKLVTFQAALLFSTSAKSLHTLFDFHQELSNDELMAITHICLTYMEIRINKCRYLVLRMMFHNGCAQLSDSKVCKFGRWISTCLKAKITQLSIHCCIFFTQTAQLLVIFCSMHTSLLVVNCAVVFIRDKPLPSYHPVLRKQYITATQNYIT